MNRKILSISIAAYNVEAYLRCALDSIVASKHLDLIDVIVVNDGSKDDTLGIATSYADAYPTSIRVVDKVNGGYGSTINTSIHLATGSYFKLLDADDWFDSYALDSLVEYLAATEVDLVITKYSSVREGEVKIISLDRAYDSMIRPIEDCLDYRFAMHMLTFKTELLKGVLTRYPILEHSNYTDFEYNVKSVSVCKSAAYLDVDLYRYRLGREGQSVELCSWFKSIDKARRVTLRVSAYYENVLDKSISISEAVKRWALEQCVGSAEYKLTLMLMMGGGAVAFRRIQDFLVDLKSASPIVYRSLLQKKARIRWIARSRIIFSCVCFPLHVKALLLMRKGR